MARRSIVHLDADAFYAAVEQAADPKLRGKPVAVGGQKRGIIASASYEARKFGVYTPMPTVKARRLCPDLIILSGDFERYEQFSHWMFGYCYDFTPDVEQTSIDEGYYALTDHNKPVTEIANTIRNAIKQRLKISVSEGIGANKLVSAVASKLHKPHAFHEVPPGQEAAFLHPLPNKWLPGIGPNTSERLNAAGLAQIRHIAFTPLPMLELILGSQAGSVQKFAHGIDERPLVAGGDPQKSFSHQETFATDLTDEEYIEAVLRRMADDLFATVRRERRSIRTITVKVRYNDMTEDQAAESLHEPTDLETDVYGVIHGLLRKAWRKRVSLRLVALKLSNVYNGPLFTDLEMEGSSPAHEKSVRLAMQVDVLRKARGHSVIMRGHDFRLLKEPVDAMAAQVRKQRFTVPSLFIPKRKLSGYVPLRVHSHYSFMDSTLSPEAIVKLAVHDEMPAVAMTDIGNLHGAVEFMAAAKDAKIKPIFGTELRVGDHSLLLYVESATGYRNLCELLSQHAERQKEKGDETAVAAQQRKPFKREDFDGLTSGLIAVSSDAQLKSLFPGSFYEMASFNGARTALSAIPCPSVHYATPANRQHYDIIQSIRTLTLLKEKHPEKKDGGRFHFRTRTEMTAACQDHPEWLAHTLEIADRCNFGFELERGKPQFPFFSSQGEFSPGEFLVSEVIKGLKRRYKEKAWRHQPQVMQELSIINEVGYADYFLLTWELLQDCKARGIQWLTRGSAADSLVCYCLGISDVCPVRFELDFRRFLNRERMIVNKLPDIDIDFAHDCKDKVLDLLFDKYRERCAIVGGFSSFQARSAFAEVSKVLGVAERHIRKFTERFPWSFGSSYESTEFTSERKSKLVQMLKSSPETKHLPVDEEPYKTALDMAEILDGMPRNPKMHPTGVVLSRESMHSLTPTFIANKGYRTTHFDMDSVEQIGLVKMDILAQGGLAAMRDVKAMLDKRDIEIDLEKCISRNKSSGEVLLGDPKAEEPWEDENVWKMIASGHARAVHHIESPAMNGLSRMCNVDEIDGLIAIVSVIRPGAANEGKKLAFTRRYQELEEPTYPDDSLKECLESTYGLIVYEEHILQVCDLFAGLSPGPSDKLRRLLAKETNLEKSDDFKKIHVAFKDGALARGHSEKKTEEVWKLLTSFTGYAFCKAHSTAYGIEAYQSAWLKYYYPAEFMAAVLSNGKGFYNQIVYVLECHRLGLKLLPPTVNDPRRRGDYGPCEKGIRVPLTLMKGLTERTRNKLVRARGEGKFTSLADFYHRVTPSAEELEAIIRSGACDEFGEPRTRQFWEAQYLLKMFGTSRQAWLIPPPDPATLPRFETTEPTRVDRLQAETDLYGFSISGHPLELYGNVDWAAYCPVNRLHEHIGETIFLCGLIVEHRIHTQTDGGPMKFLSLADWTGIIETELFAPTYKTYGLATVRYPVLEIQARVEKFDNNLGFSLRALTAGKPKLINKDTESVPLHRAA